MWHNFGCLTPYETSRDIALTAFECGIVHFDLANNYGPEPGAAESFMGSLMRGDLCMHRDEQVNILQIHSLQALVQAGHQVFP